MPCYQKVVCYQHANITNIDAQLVKKAAVLKSAWPKNVSQAACKLFSIVLRHSKMLPTSARALWEEKAANFFKTCSTQIFEEPYADTVNTVVHFSLKG